MPAHDELNQMFSLAGKVALVTGGSRGLGFNIARALASAGAVVHVNGRDADAARGAAHQIKNAIPLAFDITDGAAVVRALDHIVAQQGHLDILVNNVGARDRRPFDEFEGADLAALVNTNLVAPFVLCREASVHMAARGQGRIINITSIAGPIARAGDAAYTASKGGLDALTRALAAELGPKGITVNAIAPGYFATETNRSMVDDPETADWLDKRTSLGRWGRPEEIAGAAVFLASEAASYVTGQTIAVDGGYLSHF